MKKSICFHRPPFCTFVLPLLLFISCFVPRYRLSDKEEAFIARQKNTYDIWIQYDNKAIRRLDSNGIYQVECRERKPASFQTQAMAMEKAVDLAGKLVPIMNFKDHHRYIFVALTGTAKAGALFNGPMEYRCTVGMPVDDVRLAFVVEGMRWMPIALPRGRAAK